MNKLPVILALGVTVWLAAEARADEAIKAAAQTPSVVATAVDKSPLDSRHYRYLTLPNHLRALLVSDSTSHKVHFALDVYAGANQDPKNIPGLSRLLGFTLLNAKAGVANYVAEHDGQLRLHTQTTHTRFSARLPVSDSTAFLQRMGAALQGRHITLASIKKAQLILAREAREGVKASTQARRFDVYSALVNPDHPLARAAGTPAGVMETALAQKALKTYFSRYYGADQSTLAIRSPQTLDELQRQVVAAFANMQPSSPSAPKNHIALFKNGSLPLNVGIQTAVKSSYLRLLFPVPNPRTFYRQKPLALINSLLSSAAPGSLLALLKSLGWAETINTGMSLRSRARGLFQISIRLTDLGIRARQQVVALVFYQLAQIRDRGISSWRYSELAQLARLRFQFDNASARAKVDHLAQAMHSYDAPDVLSGPFIYQNFDEKLIRRYLDFLRSDNVLISFSSPTVNAQKRSPLLLTPYSVSSAEANQPDIKKSVRHRLSFPGANPFIPERLSVKNAPLLTSSTRMPASAEGVPEKLINKPRFNAWFLQSRHFNEPKTEVFLRLLMPAFTRSAHSAVQGMLLARVFQARLNEKAHQARVAGADFRVAFQPLGLDIKTSGYSSQQGLLLSKINSAFTVVSLDRARYQRVKTQLMQTLNTRPTGVLARLRAQVAPLNFQPLWHHKTLAQALTAVHFKDFEQFAREALAGTSAKALFYGNLYPQEALRLAVLTEHYFTLGDAVAPPHGTLGVFAKHETHANSAPLRPMLYRVPAATQEEQGVAVYVQGLGDSVKDMAHMKLLARLLRAEKIPVTADDTDYPALGPHQAPQMLIPQVTYRELAGRPSIVIALRSANRSERELAAALSQALAQPLAVAGFARDQQALLAKLSEPADTLDAQARRFWRSIIRADASFTEPARLRHAVRALTPSSLKRYYRAAIAAPARRLWLATDSGAEPRNMHLITPVRYWQWLNKRDTGARVAQ